MTAKQLIKVLTALVKEHGDQKILLMDPETGWNDTVGEVKMITKTKWNPDEGFLLERKSL